MGRFSLDRYADEYSPEILAKFADDRQRLKEYWQKKANESEEVRRGLRQHKSFYRCHIIGCQNASIGPTNFEASNYENQGKVQFDRPDRIGMDKCLKCKNWTCAEHLLHFKTPYVRHWDWKYAIATNRESYVQVCVNCLPFNASKMEWDESFGMTLDKS